MSTLSVLKILQKFFEKGLEDNTLLQNKLSYSLLKHKANKPEDN